MNIIMVIGIIILILIPVIDMVTWNYEQKKEEKKWQEWIKEINLHAHSSIEISCAYLDKQ